MLANDEKRSNPAIFRTTAEGRTGRAIFEVSDPPAVSIAEVPKELEPVPAKELGIPVTERDSDKYNSAFEMDRGHDTAEEKAAKWRALAVEEPQFAGLAERRAAAWERFSAQKKAADEALAKRLESRDSDWEKLRRLLALNAVSVADKARWSAQFARAYRDSPGIDSETIGTLAKYLPPGPRNNAPNALAKPARSGKPVQASEAPAGDAGIEWVNIPGGSFMMGDQDLGQVLHKVTIKTFLIAKTLVTIKDYRACVEAGACTAPGTGGYCNWGRIGRENHPVNCVDWNQAEAFSEWVGGRLPSEAEWEYAARSAGKDRKYTWGDEDATCEKAVINEGGEGCGRDAASPVCSRPSGNTEQGLCDMAGNAWEWVRDWYHDSYEGAPADGSAWESPAGSVRVLRGGSWTNDSFGPRAAYRFKDDPVHRHYYFSFRPVR